MTLASRKLPPGIQLIAREGPMQLNGLADLVDSLCHPRGAHRTSVLPKPLTEFFVQGGVVLQSSFPCVGDSAFLGAERDALPLCVHKTRVLNPVLDTSC